MESCLHCLGKKLSFISPYDPLLKSKNCSGSHLGFFTYLKKMTTLKGIIQAQIGFKNVCFFFYSYTPRVKN